VRRLRRFMATPLAVVLLFVAIITWTWAVLGWDAAWRMAAVLAGLGASWHRDQRRYWLWLIGIGAGLVLLHLHFTGV